MKKPNWFVSFWAGFSAAADKFRVFAASDESEQVPREILLLRPRGQILREIFLARRQFIFLEKAEKSAFEEFQNLSK